jgi:hypothetical protein
VWLVQGIPRQQVDAALGKGSDVVLRIDVQVRLRPDCMVPLLLR